MDRAIEAAYVQKKRKAIWSDGKKEGLGYIATV
jgi:hypothetical protein